MRALGIVMLVSAMTAIGLAAARPQDPALAKPSSPLTGEWRLNKELSSPLPPGDAAAGGAGSSSTPARSGGRGGRTGGGGGGFGGGRGGSRGSGDGLSSDDVLKLRAVRREFSDPADVLTIIASPSTVTFTSNQGVVRKFATDGKKHEMDLLTAKVDVTASWDEEALTELWEAGRIRVLARYQVTVQGKMLVLSLGPDEDRANKTPRADAGPAFRAKYIYERVE